MVRNCHEERQSVSPAADVLVARDWARTAEDLEARRQGRPVAEVRVDVARKTGVPTGKLYSLRRDRLKSVSRSVLAGLGNYLIRELQSDLRRIEHDLEIHTQIGTRRDDGEVLALEADATAIRKALGLEE